MRKSLFLLVAVLLSACQKEPQYATVTFGVAPIQSGSMTKVSSEAVSAALSAATPSGPFNLHLVSKSNPLRTYDVASGSAVTVAVDDYTVTGSGFGTEVVTPSTGKVYSSPKWSVSQDVSVSSGGGVVNLSASYPCVAIVIDKSVTSRVDFYNGTDYVTPSSLGGTEDVGVVFAVGYWTHSTPLRIRVYPVDNQNAEIVDYSLSSNQYDDMYRVLNGRWYNFVPGEIEPASGNFGITFGGWEAGQ